MMEKMNSAGSVKIFDAVVAAARPRRAVGLPVSLASAFAALKDASDAFSGGARLSGGAPAGCGLIAQPVVSILPDRVCFVSGLTLTA